MNYYTPEQLSRKDRYGHPFGELLKVQQEHLTIWQTVLQEPVYLELSAHCTETNAPTPHDGSEHHTCPRGDELAHLIMTIAIVGKLTRKVATIPSPDTGSVLD